MNFDHLLKVSDHWLRILNGADRNYRNLRIELLEHVGSCHTFGDRKIVKC